MGVLGSAFARKLTSQQSGFRHGDILLDTADAVTIGPLTNKALTNKALTNKALTTRAVDRNVLASETVNDGSKQERHLDRV